MIGGSSLSGVKRWLLIAVVLAGCVLLGSAGQRLLSARPSAVAVQSPAADLARLCEPVGAALKGHAQRKEFASYCRAAADVIERDAGEVIKTAETLARFNEAAGELRFAKDSQPAPGLGEAMDRAFLTHVGVKGGRLDATRRSRAVECYRAFAQAAGG